MTSKQILKRTRAKKRPTNPPSETKAPQLIGRYDHDSKTAVIVLDSEVTR